MIILNVNKKMGIGFECLMAFIDGGYFSFMLLLLEGFIIISVLCQCLDWISLIIKQSRDGFVYLLDQHDVILQFLLQQSKICL